MFIATDDEEANRRCLKDLFVTDPRVDKVRIEANKDHLLDGSCSWIFESAALKDWWNNHGPSFLWIHGNPGKGKTMIMMALIEEISERLESNPENGLLSYFFCQNTVRESRTALSVLRGLIYQLITQRRTLVRHLRKRYDDAGSQLFEGPNALYAMLEVLLNMLRDPDIPPIYFLVDALDECNADIHEMLEWILRNESVLSQKIHWLTTSRNEPFFAGHLGGDHRLHTSLEMNSEHVSRAVNKFIEVKVMDLAKQKKYDKELQNFVTSYLRANADGTFLWVALVCKALGEPTVKTRKSQDILKRFPQGLPELYEQMMERIQEQNDKEDAAFCHQILRAMTIASQPLHLEELAIFAYLPDELRQNLQSVQELVEFCGTFLSVREDYIFFVHQSAKDYFIIGKGARVFPIDVWADHNKAALLCFELISHNLRRNIAGFDAPDASPDDLEHGRLDTVIPKAVQYACLYWFTHLEQGSHGDIVKESLLDTFLRRNLLNWLEALSLLRKLSDSISVIYSLESLLEVRHPEHTVRLLTHQKPRSTRYQPCRSSPTMQNVLQ